MPTRTGLLIRAVAIVASIAATVPAEPGPSNAADQLARVRTTISGDGVYAVTTNPDGTTSIDHWYPAAGVTPGQLRTKLRAQGLPGPLGRAAILPPPDPNSGRCVPMIGSAAASCTGKWAYGPFNDPQVYFLDYSSSSWPVTDARADWWQAPGIDAYYRWNTQGCPVGNGYHCVRVYSGPYGTEVGWYGWTHVENDGNGFFKENAWIELNDSTTPNTYAARRAVACHEMGHALGMAHNLATDSCMSTTSVFVRSPSAEDFAVLNAVYPKPGT